MWEILQFLLNALLFVLIGLQLPKILDGARGQPRGDVDRTGAAVSAAVIVPRLIWAHTTVFLIRAVDRRRPARAARRLAGADDLGLVGHARRGLARGRTRAAPSVPGARPDPLPHLRGDLRDARACRGSRCRC